jgi:hypothetical protein
LFPTFKIHISSSEICSLTLSVCVPSSCPLEVLNSENEPELAIVGVSALLKVHGQAQSPLYGLKIVCAVLRSMLMLR